MLLLKWSDDILVLKLLDIFSRFEDAIFLWRLKSGVDNNGELSEAQPFSGVEADKYIFREQS